MKEWSIKRSYGCLRLYKKKEEMRMISCLLLLPMLEHKCDSRLGGVYSSFSECLDLFPFAWVPWSEWSLDISDNAFSFWYPSELWWIGSFGNKYLYHLRNICVHQVQGKEISLCCILLWDFEVINDSSGFPWKNFLLKRYIRWILGYTVTTYIGKSFLILEEIHHIFL